MNIIAQLDMVPVATQEANLKVAVRSLRFEVSLCLGDDREVEALLAPVHQSAG